MIEVPGNALKPYVWVWGLIQGQCAHVFAVRGGATSSGSRGIICSARTSSLGAAVFVHAVGTRHTQQRFEHMGHRRNSKRHHLVDHQPVPSRATKLA
jgi:hypothetical protein